MGLPINISKFAQQPKLLPLNKIIKSQDFNKKSLSKNASISKDDENIAPSYVGTIVDYLSRFVLLADDHAFDIANIKAKEEFQNGEISKKEIIELLDEEDKLARMTNDLSEVDDLPDEALRIATDICAWEMAYRSGKYVKPDHYPNKTTIQHIRVMMNRVEHFFDEYGWPVRDAFIAHTKNGWVTGDGDYLLQDTLIDLKVSIHKSMQISWVRQLLLYYALGFYNHLNDEKITRLMIYNARTDTVFYIDIADIDESVFEFVYEAAEKQSVVNEMTIKKLMEKFKGNAFD